MKLAPTVLLSFLIIGPRAFAEGKATFCYDESLHLVQLIPKDHVVREGKLIYLSTIGDVEVEGWEFISHETKYIVIASADSTVAGETCRATVIEP